MEPRTSLDSRIVCELERALRGVDLGAMPAGDCLDELRASLEVYMPALLAIDYHEWVGTECIDEVFIEEFVKVEKMRAVVCGAVMLMSDGRITPFCIDMKGDAERGWLGPVRLRLGEPGGGRIGISGPCSGSGKAVTLLSRLPNRLDSVDWVYEVRVPSYGG